jgi:Fur family transcriptional regulator, stress-responsive regulator
MRDVDAGRRSGEVHRAARRLGGRERGTTADGPPAVSDRPADQITVNLNYSGKVAYVGRVTSDFETQLRAASLRVTRPRLAVLAVLRDHSHIDTETVTALVRAAHPMVSHQTVYDVLRALTDAGLARRIQPAGAIAHYESRLGDNHHHVVCRSCGAIEDVDCAVGHAPCLTASDDHGFVVDEAEVVYWGTCPACAAERISQ